ncbi:MAG: ABC transporter ATP-binding protein [Provencibacterium sp.]|nr:ABC transporter ATP-binding protein [Provencibacterium sp.]
MMKEKRERRQALSLTLRALSDIRKIVPGLLEISALHAAVSAFGPFLTIYLSARIIGELAGQRRPDVLWPLAGAATLCGALVLLLGGVLLRLRDAKRSLYYNRDNQLFLKKWIAMDFSDTEKAENRDLYLQIEQNTCWQGFGLSKVMECFFELIQELLGVCGSIALAAGLFTLPVPASAGGWTVLNHPGMLLLFALAVAAVLGVAPACKKQEMKGLEYLAENSRFGNRIFGVFGCFVSQQQAEAAADVRMYEQPEIIRHYLTKNMVFGAKSEHGRLYRGKLGLLGALSSGIGAVLSGLIYLFVCLKAWAGAFGVGAVSQYVGAVTALTGSLSGLLTTLEELRGNVPFLRTVYRFLDIPNAMYQGSLTTEKRADRSYEVEFRDVSFRYPGAESYALRHVSMKFKIGRRLAIVGENGSGKTTFIKLLCRLYDPQEGEILLNGINIKKYNYRDYMEVFAVVFQDFQLISQPLGANVAGGADYDAPRVKRALSDAGFGERLSSLSEGLDTLLYKDFDEGGIDISGGEAQKIAIARALYRDAPFLILDEPTAALDPIAEAEIYEKLDTIVGDKTAVYISHRLSSCKFCDEILVFKEGEIVQQGTHEALLADKNGRYAALWEAQAKYYSRG